MDPSSSFEAGQASGQSSQTRVNIGMKAYYYKEARNGTRQLFGRIPEQPIDQLLTPNGNTVLHINLASLINESESSTAFVEEILRLCPSLLLKANVKGETPLHIAARYGHAAIVDVLIQHAKAPQEDLQNGVNNAAVQTMLEMTNNKKDTALHEAVRGNRLEVVTRLIGEGRDFSYSQNDAGETPLYIAVERNYEKVAFHILENCTSPAPDGPLGRTTLHAAVIVGNSEMIQEILDRILKEEQSDFIKRVDKQLWTSLHCAAYFGSTYNIPKVLLEVDGSIAYMKDAKGMTALHIAAHRGSYNVMVSILDFCPDCCELVDERGWNALHFVVNSSSSNWADFGAKKILKESSISNLLNEKDFHGNTPLHHHSKSLHYIEDVMCHNIVDKMAFNKQNLNAYDVALTSKELSDKKFMQIRSAFGYNYGHKKELRRPLGDDILPKREDDKSLKAEWKARKDRFVSSMKEASQYHLVVDTLIATVNFTAGITMPGGFKGQEDPQSGSPVLMRNTAFKAFIITNTIAMVQSCSAAFIQLFMPLFFLDKDPGDFSFLLAALAFCLSISAMGAMVLAFVMGTYAVLMHSWGLAIANSVIGLFFFIPLFFVSIGCSRYLLEILTIGSSWISDRLVDFLYFLFPKCIANGCMFLYYDIVSIFKRFRRAGEPV